MATTKLGQIALVEARATLADLCEEESNSEAKRPAIPKSGEGTAPGPYDGWVEKAWCDYFFRGGIKPYEPI